MSGRHVIWWDTPSIAQSCGVARSRKQPPIRIPSTQARPLYPRLTSRYHVFRERYRSTGFDVRISISHREESATPYVYVYVYIYVCFAYMLCIFASSRVECGGGFAAGIPAFAINTW